MTSLSRAETKKAMPVLGHSLYHIPKIMNMAWMTYINENIHEY